LCIGKISEVRLPNHLLVLSANLPSHTPS
jgi:hypothetical protein